MADEGMIITVAGPITADSLGVTDAHDHLFLNTPLTPDDAFGDVDRIGEEVREAMAGGMAAVVELTPIGLGRDPRGMRAVAKETGLHVVAATGFHRDAHYPRGHWVESATDEMLVQCMVTDLTRGMHPADWNDPSLPLDPARAGVIKGGVSYQHASPAEERRLHAIAAASLATGAPIVIHTEIGTYGHEIVDLLTGDGVAVGRITLAHLDRNPDPELHVELAARGVVLVYDTVGRIKYGPDSRILDLVEALVAAGHGDQLMLGLDSGRRGSFRAYGGGPGLRHLMYTFVPRVRRRIGDEATDRLLVVNPARIFAFAPAPAGSPA